MTVPQCSAERGNDVLGEKLDLAHIALPPTERLGKTGTVEIMIAGVVGMAEQRHCRPLGAAEMDGADGANALAEPEAATALCRHLPVKSAQA
jgi:hypothetical protein